MPKITNSDRFPKAKFLESNKFIEIGTLGGVALFKIGTTSDDILVAQIPVAMGGDMSEVKQIKALELSALATHAAADLAIDRDKLEG
jgi:hypothetical protein